MCSPTQISLTEKNNKVANIKNSKKKKKKEKNSIIITNNSNNSQYLCYFTTFASKCLKIEPNILHKKEEIHAITYFCITQLGGLG